MPDEDLQPVTIYLPREEVKALKREADENGRTGVSQQVRWILGRRRRGNPSPHGHVQPLVELSAEVPPDPTA